MRINGEHFYGRITEQGRFSNLHSVFNGLAITEFPSVISLSVSPEPIEIIDISDYGNGTPLKGGLPLALGRPWGAPVATTTTPAKARGKNWRGAVNAKN